MKLLNILFTFLHLAIIIFNLTGWIWKKTRNVHLVVVGMTLASWFLLGIWKGWGYCFLTDWHWRIQENMGENKLPNSFIKYMADKISGLDIDTEIVDVTTLSVFLLTIVFTVYVNFISRKQTN